MPLTIAQFSQNKGCSKQAIYSAIDRSKEVQEHTFKGISNGKETLYLDDTAIALLERTMRFPTQNTEIITTELRANVLKEKEELTQGIVGRVNSSVHADIENMGARLQNSLTNAVGRAIVSERISELKESHTRELAHLNSDRERIQANLSATEIEKRKLEQENYKLKMDLETVKLQKKSLEDDINEIRHKLTELYRVTDEQKVKIEQQEEKIKQQEYAIDWLHNHPVKNLLGGKKNG